MKIAITGHTRGLGKAVAEHFAENGHQVIGMSRGNGYDLRTSFNEIVAVAQSCDVFFNNAHCGSIQADLIKALHSRTKVITSGSMAVVRTTRLSDYDLDKQRVEAVHVSCRRGSTHPMLLLRMGYLENYPHRMPATYNEVVAAIEFWLGCPRVSMIEFDNVIRFNR